MTRITRPAPMSCACIRSERPINMCIQAHSSLEHSLLRESRVPANNSCACAPSPPHTHITVPNAHYVRTLCNLLQVMSFVVFTYSMLRRSCQSNRVAAALECVRWLAGQGGAKASGDDAVGCLQQAHMVGDG